MTFRAPETMAEFLQCIRAEFGPRIAAATLSETVTYLELASRADAISAGLVDRGVGKYSRVAFSMPNGPEWIATFLAVTRLGAVAVPLSTFATGPELVAMLKHADCQVLIGQGARGRKSPLDVLQEQLPTLLGADKARLLLPVVPSLRCVINSGEDAYPWAIAIDEVVAGGDSIPAGIIDALEAEVHSTDPAVMIYTSGTTSMPKGVVHSHGGVTLQARYMRDTLGFVDGERAYTNMPFFWVGGLAMNLLPTLLAGGLFATTERLDVSEILALIEKYRVSRVSINPPRALASLLAHEDFSKRDLSSVERGAPGLPAEFSVKNSASNTVDGFASGLGMTETFAMYSWCNPDDVTKLVRFSPGWDVRLVDEDLNPVQEGEEGEIQVRGPHLTIGLQKMPREKVFTLDGYYRTGDIGRLEGGFIAFKGRGGDVIKTNGANVSTAEVAQCLAQMEGVEAAFIVDLPDAERGALVAAVVVPKAGFNIEESDVTSFAAKALASYKVPTVIAIVEFDEVPMTPSGKLDMRRCRSLLELHRAP